MDVGASTIAGGDGTTEDVVCADHEPDGYMRQDKKGWGGGGRVTIKLMVQINPKISNRVENPPP